MEDPPHNATNSEERRRVSAPNMKPSPQGKALCSSCHGEIEAADTYCRHCGRRRARSEAWYHEPIAIAVLAFTVLGPFALPLVWKSPRISRNGKWAWTVALTILTAVIVYCFWFICAILIRQWRELNDVMMQMR